MLNYMGLKDLFTNTNGLRVNFTPEGTRFTNNPTWVMYMWSVKDMRLIIGDIQQLAKFRIKRYVFLMWAIEKGYYDE